jgi:hypothetical protein
MSKMGSHKPLDICSTSYGKKKGRKSNCQFDSRPLKVGNRPDLRCVQGEFNKPLESSQRELQLYFKPRPNQRSEQRVIVLQSCRSPNHGSFRTPLWESQDKKSFGCGCHGEAHRILYEGRWWLPLNPGRDESYESRVARGLS